MTEVTPPSAPAEPTTPAEAQARLSQAKQDPAWSKALLDGSPKQLTEFHKLHEMIATSPVNVDKAMAGEFLDINPPGHLEAMGVAKSLQEAGIESAVIRQLLTNGSVSREEFDKAASVKSMLMKNSEFTQKLMADDGEAKRSWKLLNIILSSDVKPAAA
jgi:hypothetical protein